MKKVWLFLCSLFILSSCAPVDDIGGGAAIGELPPPMGPKKLIAVAEFENKANVEGQIALGTGMAEQLTDSLMQSGHFIVLERQDIKGILEEQNFGVSGRATTVGGAKIGKIQRAQILIKGAITEFSHETSGSGQDFHYEGVSFGFESNRAHVGVIVYLYDTTTGQVIDSQRCEGKAESGGLAWSYNDSDMAFGSSGFKATPLGKATQLAIDKAVYFIVKRMSNVPWHGRIIKVKRDLVYVNAGSSGGIQIGDEFEVFQEEEGLVDPESGMYLGADLNYIGKVQVTEVQEKYSKAIIIAGQGFEKNNVLKFVPRHNDTTKTL